MKIKTASLALCMVILLTPSAFSMENNPEVIGVLSFLEGDIYISPDGENWKKGSLNMEIRIGDHVKTGEDARCEIALIDKSVLRLDGKTIQEFEERVDPLKYPPRSIWLSAGKIWLNARNIISEEDSFKVRTNKAVCAIRGTTFSVEERKTYTRIRVMEGEVTSWSAVFDKKNVPPQSVDNQEISKSYPVKAPYPISMQEWIEVVKAPQQITIDMKGGFEKQDFDLATISQDPWVQWNMKRDNPAENK